MMRQARRWKVLGRFGFVALSAAMAGAGPSRPARAEAPLGISGELVDVKMRHGGMFGGWYVGAPQMLAAIGHPPHLAGIFPMVTASNYHEGWTYQGGAFEQWFNESWAQSLADNTLEKKNGRLRGGGWPTWNM